MFQENAVQEIKTHFMFNKNIPTTVPVQYNVE